MKIIAFTGYKKSGKDAAAKQLSQILLPATIKHVNFADALKQEVAVACGTTLDYINTNKDVFRTILQWWGTDFRRNLVSEHYWTVRWLRILNEMSSLPDYLLCTDVRFANEAFVVRSLGGIIIRVQRPDIQSDGHASETEQLVLHAEFTVNNDGTLDDLKEKLKNLKL